MIEINETKETMERLKLEGKTRVLDTPQDIKVMIEMNEHMRKVSEDYSNKESRSWINAEKCFIYQNN
jgi:hypothetical protein